MLASRRYGRSPDLRSGTGLTACLSRRTPRGAWSSARLWCVQYIREQTLFYKAGDRAVCFEMGGVDHQAIIGIDGNGRSISSRRIPPA